MRHATLLLFILLWLRATPCDALSHSQCVRMVEQIQQVYDQYPDSDIVNKTIQRCLPVLRSQTDHTYYFMVCNTYADWLFRHGDLTAARNEIRRIMQIANSEKQPELMAVARRAEGQFMMRFGFNDRALTIMEEALKVCPGYRKLKVPTTYSTILLQLAKLYMYAGRPNDAERMLICLDEVLADMDRRHLPDRYHWLHARVAALHAGLELMRGNVSLCEKWLAQSDAFRQPDAHPKFYYTFFMVRNALFMRQSRYKEALAGCDTLLNLHYDVLPMRPLILRQRATALRHLGRGMEAAMTLERYIGEDDHATRMADAARIEMIRDEYRLAEAEQKKREAEHDRMVLLAACTLLLAALVTICVMAWKLRKKNVRLVSVLRSADRLVHSLSQPHRNTDGSGHTHTDAHNATGGNDAGQRGIRFLTDSAAYCHLDGGRAALATHLGTSERQAVAAVAEAAGCSFKAYTNTLKLKESRRLLEEEPLMTVAAVATACGFGTVRTYQALFKDKYGISPSQYRAKLAEATNDEAI